MVKVDQLKEIEEKRRKERLSREQHRKNHPGMEFYRHPLSTLPVPVPIPAVSAAAAATATAPSTSTVHTNLFLVSKIIAYVCPVRP